MADKLQKLELTWIGKDQEPKLEPRILIENPDYSFGNSNTKNMLIQGDNLLALKAIDQDYAGKIKCIYIDPPYNTGTAFEHYDDGIEHSLWLNLMKPRLLLLKNLLKDDGSIWISIDDNEAHYLKVLCDEIFGRQCFISNIIWRKRDGPPNDRKLGSIHENILVYGKTKKASSKKTLAEENFNLSPRTEKANSQYKVFAEPTGPDPRGPFRKIDTTANGKGGRYVASLNYPVLNPFTGEEVYPRQGTCWRHNKDEMIRLQDDKRLYWGVDGKSKTPMRKLFMSEVKDGMATSSIWYDLALNQHGSQEVAILFGEKAFFETPKPEGLLRLILHIASNPGDVILDSFLGSGTTAAVAHKMGRSYIGIELGEHAKTHCYLRLKAVTEGEQGGISEDVNWKGGGGFKFYSLAPSLLNKDKYGNWVIAKEYNPTMMAAAMAKQEGFHYSPDDHVYWKQGRSSEKDYIYTTTQFITLEILDRIHNEMQSDESLLISCKAFHSDCETRYVNISIKKIPQMLLGRCEFAKDDYSLNIINLPKDETEESEVNEPVETYQNSNNKKSTQPNLFD